MTDLTSVCDCTGTTLTGPSDAYAYCSQWSCSYANTLDVNATLDATGSESELYLLYGAFAIAMLCGILAAIIIKRK